MPGIDLPTILLLVGVAALFYFMLIRPQQKRSKEQQKLMSELSTGDRVMTISGIIGTVRYLGEKQAIIEISPGVEMTVVKGAISTQPVEDEFEYSDSGRDDDAETDGEADVPESSVEASEPGEKDPSDTESGDSTATGENTK